MKKKTLKLLSIAAVAVLGFSMISGCGKDDSKLIMGTNAAFPPFEYISSSEGVVGEFAGIDVEIADKIAKSMDKELQINNMEFAGLIAAVQTGKVDMAVAGMTAKPERLEVVDFSDTYFVAEQVIIVKADNTDITKANDLKNNKKVGVVVGYTGDTIVTDDLELNSNNIVRVNRGIDAVEDLKNGRLDAVVIDSETGKALASKNGLNVVADPEIFAQEEYAIAVKKGNKELLEKINAVLKEMKENGEIDKLNEKYNK